ncbi:hypothetical protein H7F10_06895 [Acidithiobacillus sp. HP-6]|uniref:hypothetical protein n=1 Tax=unclassified Acidithiobacillus TaxID=2614800 RepID=UPI00187AB7D9|nr:MULTISPECIES: hypothetical protein [unclassified Acidithiobacillus]MBE7562681.1 hypothetical protein [Acidithiobacillus sp. HP-6]MBE7570523.1 hypothetical protein [Acidithiobacillus sp. HP-2]
MSFDLSGWKPGCEQAKHLAGSFRIAGIAFFAAVAGPDVHAILSDKGVDLVINLTVGLCLLEWAGFEVIGYMILGKGGC